MDNPTMPPSRPADARSRTDALSSRLRVLTAGTAVAGLAITAGIAVAVAVPAGAASGAQAPGGVGTVGDQPANGTTDPQPGVDSSGSQPVQPFTPFGQGGSGLDAPGVIQPPSRATGPGHASTGGS
jgi:hypothetical protein